MPKETFFNLPEPKRQMIEDAATDEFATWGYDNASVNRIVEACQIAKGSFYQYFEDKADLYKHLLMRIGEQKLTYLSPVSLNPSAHDFFALLTDLYRSGLAFAKANPKAALIGNQILKNRDHPVYQSFFVESKGMVGDFFGPLLALGKERGEIRSDVDVGFVSYALQAMNIATIEYYFEVVQRREFDINAMDDDIMDTVELFLDFIKSGIGTQVGKVQ